MRSTTKRWSLYKNQFTFNLIFALLVIWLHMGFFGLGSSPKSWFVKKYFYRIGCHLRAISTQALFSQSDGRSKQFLEGVPWQSWPVEWTGMRIHWSEKWLILNREQSIRADWLTRAKNSLLLTCPRPGPFFSRHTHSKSQMLQCRLWQWRPQIMHV